MIAIKGKLIDKWTTKNNETTNNKTTKKEIPKTYSKQIKNLCAHEQRWMRTKNFCFSNKMKELEIKTTKKQKERNIKVYLKTFAV